MSDLISIIIPVYNVEKYLVRCVDSVIAQTYENIEVILVNDGSTDESQAICEKYVVSDSRIKLINKENGGLSDARNAGITCAEGEYIAFIDSDDYVHQLFIENLYSRIKSDNSDICMCAFHFVNEGEEDYSAIKKMPDSYDYHAEGIAEGVYSSDTAMKHISNTRLVVAWNKLYRRKLFNNIRFPVGRLHEDEFILHGLFAISDDVSIISDKLYFYLQRALSIIGQPYCVRRLDILDAYADRMDFYITNVNVELLKCTCLGYVRRYTEAYTQFQKSNENISRLNECRNRFITYQKVMFRYGGMYIGIKFLLAAINPRLNRSLSGLLHCFRRILRKS